MARASLDPAGMLTEHRVLQCSDFAEFDEFIAGWGADKEGLVDPDVMRRSGPADIELRTTSLGRVDVFLMRCGADVAAKASRGRSASYLVQFALSAEVDYEIDGRHLRLAPGEGVVLSPNIGVRRRQQPGWALVFSMDVAFVRARLEERAGRAPEDDLVFEPVMGDRSAELLDYALLVVEAIDRGVAAPDSALAGVLEKGLVDLLLDLQPHAMSEAIAESERASRLERVRVVKQFVTEHVGEPLELGDLARAASCSGRALQAAFLELCRMTPMEFVRRHRLARAHGLLEQADAQTTVSKVALAVGFTHLSRFSAAYHAMFGESPSSTLRRARASGRAAAP